jgi:alpha-tubulin suppressor-like RCC1 family protein
LYRIDLGTVDAPRFTGAAPGSYPTFRSVTITTETSGATIHYTTDGRDPDETSPVVASGSSVVVGQPLLLRARAFKSGMTPSPIIQGIYRITGAAAAARGHVMALKADGSVWSWGSNNWGMLGDPSFAGSRRATPGQVPGLTDVVAISGGGQHSLALKRDGTIWSWGQNTWGQLGDGTSTDRTSPVQVSQTSGLTNAVEIAAGVTHSLALASDGSIWIWGLDGLTQFGGLPVHVNNLSGIAQIAAGAFSATLKTDGEPAGQVWTFGYNGFGNLGDGTKTDRTASVPVIGLSNGVAIAAGDSHGLAVTSGGSVSAWGSNSLGQLGDGTTTEHLSPIVVPGLSQIVLVSAGGAHSFFLQNGGKAFAAGYNYLGALGVGEVGEHYNPTAVVSPEKLTSIASLGANAAVHSSAVAPTGHVLVWGNGTDGELGNGTFDTSSGVPLVVPDFSVTTDALLTSDVDGDGLSNEEEVALGTDPGNRDTNGDGVPDGAAVQAGISPTNTDMDGDGVSNAAEALAGTDPFLADTDGDGVNDGQDCFPLDPTRWQCPAPDPNDHTPPVITLQEPTNAQLISSVPPQ